eukprot:gene11147-12319_t
MDSCALELGINDCLKSCMSNPMSTGPTPRWQRKLQSQSRGTPLSPVNAGHLTNTRPKQPAITPGKTCGGKNPVSKKTPGKGSSNATNIPNTNCDRFIPNRAFMDLNRSHHMLLSNETSENSVVEELDETADDEYNSRMKRNLGASDSKILAMKCKAPVANDGHMSKVLYSQNKSSTAKWKSSRFIPNTPERILDAPDITNDYYLNLIDWGNNNSISVALGGAVFLWNATTSEVYQLLQADDNELITSVSWVKEGNVLAVGFDNGTVELWDADAMKKVRTMRGHAGRVGSMAWNSYILSSGSRTGAIHQNDVRIPQHCVATLQQHSQEVCGLQWSPNGIMLASGGNDNVLNIWDVNVQSTGDVNNPIHSLADHRAAVKAVAWCPWQPQILASGGGTADRHIRTWNTQTGVCLQSTDTKSQVSGIIWSEEHKELISGHGYSDNQLSIWKYPSMNKVTELTGHTSRVICIAQSSDHSMIASAGADETIRLWKCFGVDAKKHKAKAKAKSSLQGMHGGGIR